MGEDGLAVVLTVILAIAKYLPRGTRVGLLANLENDINYEDGRDDDEDRCVHSRGQ